MTTKTKNDSPPESPLLSFITDGKPKIIGIASDVNSGKSNLIHFLITELMKNYKLNISSFGIHFDFGEQKIYSVKELEATSRSLIFIDEMTNLIDLDDRKKKELVERTFRLVNHPEKNNIIVLCGIPENFRKFLSAKVNVWMFKRCTIADCINGSKMKKVMTDYQNFEQGAELLDIPNDMVLVYDGSHYNRYPVPYLKEYDRKLTNAPIVVPK